MPERISRYCLLPAVVIFLFLSACNSSVVFSDARAMKNNSWNLMDILSFDIPVEDTINSNNVFFTVRSGTSYPFRNIYLFVSTTSPDGKTISDTLQYFLADESGNWFGKGFGDIKELKLPYKSNVYFPRKGNYRFTVQHGMRTEDLKGIYDFGIRIEKISR
ncbi:MAG TPA: gliding motility lipoprotein GldH [Bacteroidales bacterium]|nr:gliding motility lipoprotein GldH [Bacteroidales bacterium]